MKKILLSFVAVVALFATSCITEATSDLCVGGNEALVSFTLKAPATRAALDLDETETTTIGDGYKATQLHYAVYDKDWTCLKRDVTSFPTGSLTQQIQLRLVKNKTYNFVFWAQAPYNSEVVDDSNVNSFYAVNLGQVGDTNVEPTIVVTYGTDANNDYRDAFHGNFLGLVVDGTENETVELRRPFAQVNFGVYEKDVNDAMEMGFDITAATSKTSFTVTACNTLNLKDGSVNYDAKQDYEFVAAKLPENKTLYAKYNGADVYCYWVAMNYVLWPTPSAGNTSTPLPTCKMTMKADGQEDIEISFPNAPARPNYRTNLIGNLLTEEAVFNVTINPIIPDTDQFTKEFPTDLQ